MKTQTSILYWMPRIICILAILFVSVFALDSFSPELSVGQQIGAFLIHLIPSFVLIILLFVAWKWEFAGGIIFTLTGLGFSPFIFINNYRANHSVWTSALTVMIITFPFVVVGILFLINYFKTKRLK